MHFHCQPAMPRFSPDQQESQRTTAQQQPPQCLFSTDLLLTSFSAEPHPGRTGQPGAAPAVHTCIPHFTPTPWLFRSCSSSSPSKSTTSFSFHRPQLLPHVCCSLKDAKQAEDVQASSQRHCSNVSFLYSSSYCSHTHTHLNSAPPALGFNLHTSSLIYNGFSYAKGKILLKFGPQHSSIQVPGLPLPLHYQSASPRASYPFSR